MISDADRELLTRLDNEASKRPANTTRAYAKGWSDWQDWAFHHDTPAAPADDDHLALWTIELSARCKPASVRLYARGVSVAHIDSDLSDPFGGGRAAEALRVYGTPGEQHQARPVTGDEIPLLLEAALWRGNEGYRCRMTALILVMRYAGLRRSEAAALEWSDLHWLPDGSASISIRRSKTSKTPVPRWLPSDAADALRDWLLGGSDADDSRIFGWSPVSISRHIGDLARRAGLDGVSTHSFRKGATSDLLASGAPVGVVMEFGRWRTEAMVSRYARGAQASRPWIEALSETARIPT